MGQHGLGDQSGMPTSAPSHPSNRDALAIEQALAQLLPTESLVRAAAVRQDYARDWTRTHPPNPSAVVRPGSTEEVLRVVRWCAQHRVALVPSGGRTGLAGGAVAAQGEVVLSLDRMRGMGEVDPVAHTLDVQAGVVTADVHAKCAPHGLTWPIHFAAEGSSTVGGNIATNAGGMHVLRYGSTRAWVLGLEVIAASGKLMWLNDAREKDNTGLDLRQLYIGTEGTLGVITRALLRLCPLPAAGSCRTLLLGVDDLGQALKTLSAARQSNAFHLRAFEYVAPACIEAVAEDRGVAVPMRKSGAYLLIEVEGTPASVEGDALAWFAALQGSWPNLEGTLAADERQRAELWSLREGIGEALARRGKLHKYDVAVPLRELQAFASALEPALATAVAELQPYVFGHLGDGNLHINLLQQEGVDDLAFTELCALADKVVYGLVQSHRGSVSAEHGIGLLRRSALTYTRSPEEIAVMQAVKKALDPNGLLNPGKGLPCTQDGGTPL